MQNEAYFADRLLHWYDAHQRDLPWRRSEGTSVHTYYTLISEYMLQQTQVATVLPYFSRFIHTFPDLPTLAASDESTILRLWQGLGYYSRARNLLKTAQALVREHGGEVPRDVETLMTLPGIGRYTAGAIASLAHGTRAPILDGNVARVLCRLDLIQDDPRDRQVQQKLWTRAEEVLPAKRVGAFNSALMELGATVCTPRNPKCDGCPVQQNCKAFSKGMQSQIPPPKKAKPSPQVERTTLCIRKTTRQGTFWMIEQRPSSGRWASLWQFVTTESATPPLPAKWVVRVAGVKCSPPRFLGRVEHALTHRKYRFDAFSCDFHSFPGGSKLPTNRRWVRLDQLHEYALPKPQIQIAKLLAQLQSAPQAAPSER